MKAILAIIAFCAAIYTSYSLCNSCSAITNIACVANDKFSVCVDGLPTTFVTQCPAGTVCTSTASICSSTATGSCSRCGKCSTNKIFACTSYNTFALCYGSTVPNNVNFTCSGNLACNVDDPQICTNPAVTGMGATCPSPSATVTPTTTVKPTTTVSPTINPQAYCKSLGSNGRFEITTDPYCKQYVYCSLVNSTWVGNLYDCPGSTFFNSTSRLCGVEIPLRCA